MANLMETMESQFDPDQEWQKIVAQVSIRDDLGKWTKIFEIVDKSYTLDSPVELRVQYANSSCGDI